MLNGIDISSWQSGINISSLTTTDFVIVKATGGTSYTNDCLTNHANATLAAGKLLGLYHYAREKSCKGTAAEEAQHFVDAVKPYIGKAVLVLDWEEELSCGESWALTWLNQVKKLTGVSPLFYCYQAALASNTYSNIAAAGYKLWLAQYASMSAQYGYRATPWQSGSIGAFSSYIIHQYSSKGRITGYGADLDLDQFRGGVSDWKALCSASSSSDKSGGGATASDYSPSVAGGTQKFKNSTGAILPIYSSTRMQSSEKIGSVNAGEECWCFGKVYSPTSARWLWAVAYAINGTSDYKIGYTDDGGGTSFN